ncbi:Phytochrome-like protein cph1 [Burkholderiales bacterium]|nr:Phytochrome-like protein cph1 [Burkholderiales bacterium]
MLALGLVVTLFLAKRVTDHTTGEVEARFAARGDLLAAHLSRRLNDLQNLILGLQGVFIASPDVTRAEFHQYARNLDLAKRLGGLQAMSYHRRVTLAERHAFMAAVRTDRSLVPEGYPRFDIRPPGDRAEYLVADFVEPMVGNEAVFGFDVATQASNAAAIAESRDLGEFRISEPFHIVQSPQGSPRVVLRAPVYRRGERADSPETRRLALSGFVVLTVETRSSFRDYFRGMLDTGESLVIEDAGLLSLGAPGARQLVAEIGEPREAHALAHERTLEFGGRRWVLRHRVGTSWVENQPAHGASLRVLGVGLIISLLLAALYYVLGSARNRALELVAQRTRVLRATLDNTSQGISVFDGELRLLGYNQRFAELLDMPASLFRDHAPFEDFIRHNARRGEYGPGEVEEQVEERVELAKRFEPHHLKRARPDGTVLEIIGKPLPGGGMVTTYTDITVQEKAREAVQSSEQRYRTLVQMSPDAVFAHRDGQIVLANPAAAALVGAGSAEALLGLDVERLVAPEDRERVRQRIALLASGEMQHAALTELRYHRLDGRVIEVESTGNRIELDGLPAVLTVARDITERRRIAVQIQRERDFRQHLIESIPGVFYLFDQEGHFLLWNRNFQRVAGYSDEEMARAHPLDFFAGADQELIRGRIGRAFTEGTATAEAVFLSKDGHGTPYFFTGERVTLDDGRPGLVGVGLDIAERKRSEEALRRQSEILQTTLEHLPEGIGVTDGELRMVAMNRHYAELLDLPGNLCRVGADIAEFFRYNAQRGEYGPGDVEAQVAERVALAKKFEAHHFKRVRPNGRILDIRGTPLPGGGFVSSFADITEQEAAQSALRRSEQRYRNLIDLSPDAIIVHRHAIVLVANPAAAALCGLASAAEAVGRDILEFVHPDSREQVRERIATLESNPDLFRLPRSEIAYLRKDGSPIPVEGTATVIHMDDGPAILSVIRDLSERHEADALIRRERDFSRKLIESVPGIFYLFDASGNLVLWNRNLERLLGRSSEELATLQALRLYHESDWPTLRRAAREVIKHGTSSLEANLLTRDGRQIPYYVTGLRYEVDNRLVVIAMGIDVTERKRAEAAIQASETRFRSIFERAIIGIATAESDGTLTGANEALAQILGYSREELKGMNIGQFTHPDDLAVELVYLAELAQGTSDCYRMDKRYITRRGETVWVDLLVNLQRDEQGRPFGVLGMVVDISERKEAERTIRELNESLERRVEERTAELAASNQELESFSYSVSHDLRAPLRAMNGFSQLLETQYGSRIDEKGLDYLARIRGASKRMGELIDSLLELARLSRLELRREALDLAPLAGEIRASLEEHAPERKVRWNIAAHLPARADPVLVRALLENLLRNAWKFTAERADARIELSQIEQDGEAVFMVRDNGAGFSMEYAEQLFKPFQRLHDPKRFEGTGIGLAIVQRIVRRHGGRVWASSVDGQGASFYFTLP